MAVGRGRTVDGRLPAGHRGNGTARSGEGAHTHRLVAEGVSAVVARGAFSISTVPLSGPWPSLSTGPLAGGLFFCSRMCLAGLFLPALPASPGPSLFLFRAKVRYFVQISLTFCAFYPFPPHFGANRGGKKAVFAFFNMGFEDVVAARGRTVGALFFPKPGIGLSVAAIDFSKPGIDFSKPGIEKSKPATGGGVAGLGMRGMPRGGAGLISPLSACPSRCAAGRCLRAGGGGGRRTAWWWRGAGP